MLLPNMYEGFIGNGWCKSGVIEECEPLDSLKFCMTLLFRFELHNRHIVIFILLLKQPVETIGACIYLGGRREVARIFNLRHRVVRT
ncbi:hypothetical protein L798_01367 [Zootermopsis nevadensis]|uniref:Uncharacterized protein n=1 Tax=Zootermopsis nevadensis TaxID=136037 RepID=A0A067QTP2_ZOONE|nr:hypothetical protein L798_01367 [Zootermopsis nevadensis]